MLSLASDSVLNTNIRQSMLKLPTYSGFHNLFLKYTYIGKSFRHRKNKDLLSTNK